MLNLLQSVTCAIGLGGDDVEDVLPTSVSSLEELDHLCAKVADKTFKRKLVTISCIVLDMRKFWMF